MCDGYIIRVKTGRKADHPQRKQTKPLLPKDATLQVLPISRLNAGVGFEDELNGRCFRIYIEKTARQINGPFPNPLWGTLIPQISEREPFVRHAIIAIGALGKSQLHQAPGTSHNLGDYRYALKLYERSLRGMREAIAGGKHDLRNALIACLLVFIFEGMLGNQAAAVIHAESGLNLLFESAVGNDPGKPWRGQKENAHLHFEDDLLEAFNALDLQVLLFIDRRSKAIHENMKAFQTYIIGTLPAEFSSLDQARHFWQLIVNRNYHFLKSLQSLDIEILQEERLGSEEGSSANMEANELLLSSSEDAPMTRKEEHLRYRIDIGRWTCTYCLKFYLYLHIFSGVRQVQDDPVPTSSLLPS